MNVSEKRAAMDVLREKVKSGAVLEPWERRALLEFLDDTHQYKYNELAKILGVNIRTVFKDREFLKKQLARGLSIMKPIDFVAEFIRTQQMVLTKLRKEVESGMLGPKEMIAALDKISVVSQRILVQLQALGALPHQLGTVNVVQERWVAEVAEGGQILLTGDTKSMPVEEFERELDDFIEVQAVDKEDV